MAEDPPVTTPPKQSPRVQPQSKTVEDKDLIASILYLKKNNLIKESKSIIKFTTTKEAEDSAKEDAIFSINEKLNSLKQNISELQKFGYNLKLDGIKLLRVPLKTKVWLSTTKEKDIDSIFQILSQVQKVVEVLIKEKEQKEKKKDQREKEKEQKEKQEQIMKEQKKTQLAEDPKKSNQAISKKKTIISQKIQSSVKPL